MHVDCKLFLVSIVDLYVFSSGDQDTSNEDTT